MHERHPCKMRGLEMCSVFFDVAFYLLCIALTVVAYLDVLELNLDFLVPSCGDIRYSFDKPKSETISMSMVSLVSVFCPIVLFFFIEMFRKKFDSKCWRVKCSAHVIWQFLVGGLYSNCIVEIIKTITEQPRPYFINACGTCNNETTPLFISVQNCTNFNSEDLREVAKSFPSGHANMAVFSLVYLAGYLQAAMPSFPNSPLVFSPCTVVRKWLLFFFTIFTTVTCFTRVSDHVHHFGDVFGGAFVGAVVGLYMVMAVTDNFKMIREGCEREIHNHEAIPMN